MPNDDNEITLVLHPDTLAYLAMIAETSLYGDSVEAVAIGLIDQGIRNAVKDRFIESVRQAAIPIR